MVEGYELNEIASELGQSPSWVSERLNELRDELLLDNGRFFPLTDQEYGALRQSISDHGVQTPIVIGEHIALIDGRHRSPDQPRTQPERDPRRLRRSARAQAKNTSSPSP